MNEMMKNPAPQLLVVIADAGRRETVATFLKECNMRVFQCRGKGTATNEIMDIFGLAATDKVITLCLTAKQIAPRLMERLREMLRLERAGGGIAFTVPCSGIASPVLRLLEEETRNELFAHIESEVNLVKKTAAHDLIIAVINQGFSEELVEQAKQFGATGGTVVHANQILDHERAKNWGITVSDEKEIVVMLVHREQKMAIMRAVSKACGMGTDARGLVFSLPVDEVEGLSERM